jgi:hypothetical protein
MTAQIDPPVRRQEMDATPEVVEWSGPIPEPPCQR